MSSGSLVSYLKEKTFDLHQNLDSNSSLVELFSDSLTQGSFFSILNCFRKFYICLARELATIDSPNILESRSYQNLVVSVNLRLEWLGLDSNDIHKIVESFKVPFSSPEINDVFSPSFLIGILYVVEGSSLGGAYIYSKLKRNANLNSEDLKYFRGRHSSTKKVWDMFVEEINNSQSDSKKAMFGARWCFQELIYTFS